MKNLNVLLLTLIVSSLSFAQDTAAQPETSPWAHESEVAIVTVDGNTKTSSYSAKQKTTYSFGEKNSLTATARYLETETGSITTAKSWDAGARYERTISDLWAAFLGHKAESDRFAGYIQRDSTDLGAKYLIRKTDDMQWTAEAGYSYIKTYATDKRNSYDPAYRIYTEYNKSLEKNLSFKYWLEYIESFAKPRSGEMKTYYVNTEASLNVMLTQVFSLKTAYLLKYQNNKNKTIPPKAEYTDTTFTTSLVAKF